MDRAGDGMAAVDDQTASESASLPARATTDGLTPADRFVARALARGAHLDPADRDVASICHLAGQLPPAIDAAAELLDVLSVQEVAARIQDPAHLLALPVPFEDGRVPLGEVLDRQHGELDERSQVACRRLAALPGGFSLSAGEHIAAGGLLPQPAVLGAVTDLLARSVLRRVNADGRARFEWTHPWWVVSWRHLEASDEAAAIRDRQAEWCLEQAAAAMAGPEPARWAAIELDNVRAALDWLAETNGHGAVRLIVTLMPYWRSAGSVSEVRARLDRAIDGADHAAGAEGLLAAAELAVLDGDLPTATRRLDECRAVAEATGDQAPMAEVLGWRGLVAQLSGDLDEAERLSTESLELHRRDGDQVAVAHRLLQLGRLTSVRGDRDTARFLYRQALRAFRSADDLAGVADCLERLGQLARISLALAGARPLLREALELRRRLGGGRRMASAALELARLDIQTLDFEEAAELLAEAHRSYAAVHDRRGLAGVAAAQGQLGYITGDHDAARRHFGEALSLYDAFGDRRGRAIAMVGLANALFLRPAGADALRARELTQEAWAELTAIGDLRGAAWAGYCVAEITGDLGDTAAAKELAHRAIELYRACGDETLTGLLTLDLAEFALREGDIQRAARLATDALTRAREHGIPIQMIRCLEVVAGIDLAGGHRHRAAVLHFACHALRVRHSAMPARARLAARNQAEVSALRDALDEPVLAELERRGLSLSLEEAVLLGLGQPAAIEPDGTSVVGRTVIHLFGELQVVIDGEARTLPPGTEARLLMVIALLGPRHIEELADMLWPDAEAEVGRRRLRNAMSKLRARIGPVVVRRGEQWRLAEDVTVDAHQFVDAGVRALGEWKAGKPGADGLCRSALAIHRGDLLPTERYEDWITTWRLRCSALHLDLLDALASHAETGGYLTEALDWLERAIEADPFDVDRYIRATRLMVERGWRSRARAMARRAQKAAGELGLPRPPELVALIQELGLDAQPSSK